MSLKPDSSYLHLLLDQPVYLIQEPDYVQPVLPPVAEKPAIPVAAEKPAIAAEEKLEKSTPPILEQPPVAEKPDKTTTVPLTPVLTDLPQVTKPIPQEPKATIPVQPPVVEAKPVVKGPKVMVLFNNQQSTYLKPAEEALLIKILQSVGLQLDEVDLVNLNNIKRINYVDILKEKELNQLISFGIDLRELDLQIPLLAYEVKKVEGIALLLADSLTELEINTDKKKMLWKALKQMFAK
jgi:DNA polymerase III psi subunit